MKSFVYHGRTVPMKSGGTGIRFLTLYDAEHNQNPLYQGDTGWRKAPYEMHLVTNENVLCLSVDAKSPNACVRKEEL